MYGKNEIKAFLDEKGILYEWVEHEAVFTIEEVMKLGLEDEDAVAKNLFLRDGKGKRHFLVVIRGEKQANLKELGERFQAGRLSFASEERLMKYLGLKKGSVTPFGILNDVERAVEVYFDEDFLQMERIGVHPNENTASVYLKPADLLDMIREHGNQVHVVSL